MKKLLHIAIGIGFCLMFCFLAVGYAALNDELHVTGSVSYQYVDSTEPTFPETGEDSEGNNINYGLFLGYGNRTQEGNQKMIRCDVKSFGDGTYVFNFIFTQEYMDNLPEGYTELQINCAIPGFEHKGKQIYLEFKKNGECSFQRSFGGYQNFDVEVETDVEYTMTISGVELDKGEDSKVTWSISPAITAESFSYEIDTTAVTNLTIESQETETMDLSFAPNLLLILTPTEGYLLPETFTVTISGTEYAISTAGENETETMLWEAETSTLYILGDILPTDGSPVVVTAHAVPEVPGFTLNTDMLKFMAVEWHTANGCLNLSLTPEEGYLLPESLTVTINDNPYTVCTTPEGENPAGMGYDPIANILSIHFALIPQDALIILTAEAIPEPMEEATAPTEEATDPTEETTEPTEEATEPTEETTEPAEVPTDPTEETTVLTEESTNPTEEATVPTEESTDPTEETTEPTETTIVPTEASEHPTEEAVNPTGESTDSV